MTLFWDDFSGDLGQWILLNSPAIDGADGLPAPSLRLESVSVGGGVPGPSGVQTQASFSLERLTISFDLKRTGPPGQTMHFRIRDISTNFSWGDLQVDHDKAIYGIHVNALSQQYANHPLPAPTEFHRYEFVVESSGQATWYRDGFLQQTRGGLPITNVYLLAANSSGDVGHLDNVLVTLP